MPQTATRLSNFERIARQVVMLDAGSRGGTVYLPADKRAIKIHNRRQWLPLLVNRYCRDTTT